MMAKTMKIRPSCHLLVLQVEGQVTPVNLPSSRGVSTPGSPATSITVNTVLQLLKYT